MNKREVINNKLYCNNKLFAKKIVYCNDIFSQGTGLMCRTRGSINNTGWWFEFKKPRRVGITMFFVFFSIDIIFLDENNKIIELKRGLRPFSNYISKNKIYSFIELDFGTIDRYLLKIGMHITSKN
jgi:uncharacterized membrane protein (UPF0127 family)